MSEIVRETPQRTTFERSWGTATTLRLESDPGRFDVCIEEIQPGERIPRHYHPVETEQEVVLRGNGWLLHSDDRRERIENGQFVNEAKPTGNIWSPEEIHGYEADENGDGLTILTLTSPPWQEDHEIPVE